MTQRIVIYDETIKRVVASNIPIANVNGPASVILALSIERPTAKTYYYLLSSKIAFTINQLSVQTTAGSCTVSVQIGGVGVTGLTTISATTSLSEPPATGANSVLAGNSVTLVVTNPSADIGDLITQIYGSQ